MRNADTQRSDVMNGKRLRPFVYVRTGNSDAFSLAPRYESAANLIFHRINGISACGKKRICNFFLCRENRLFRVGNHAALA